MRLKLYYALTVLFVFGMLLAACQPAAPYNPVAVPASDAPAAAAPAAAAPASDAPAAAGDIKDVPREKT